MVNDSEIPTFHNCDPDDPEEHFLPAFTALPGMRGAPLLMPTEYWRLVSKRLWDLGYRQVEPPTLKYRPPVGRMDGFAVTGEWVSVDEPDTEEDRIAQVVAQIGPGVRQALVDEIKRQEGEL